MKAIKNGAKSRHFYCLGSFLFRKERADVYN
ncbi:hypothetical protein Vch1786_I1799 [Vibrio cholerae O1 str. 2010EL-1786]|uniref:Uncharacterized protein n=2 Tax=Vibrio cholerae TaxID=666 RepID=Q9KPR0_VIBCH|nr:hypothetical protein VC_2306 [Vibrio cholerae O1 biovar El Tor str. N16961]ACP06530.1 conserved hypothetical protein [Vibrio cholerae M66-2]ACP10412.1 conserved hypothetical protein [Vibrio cholerae O395]AET27391.1 hypothetical protein Vch1786_I1799 [Vibrio cholerae O1 str. 2010EL-1786]